MAVDLHIHTTASDGSLSPEEIVKKAEKLRYKAIAITDHDTVDGLKKALKEAKKRRVEVIPGIEINTEYEGHEVHILGYFIDYTDPNLLKKIEYYKKLRVKRVRKIVNKLNKMGFEIDMNDVLEFAKGPAIGRSHIARAMRKKDYVQSTSEAFDKYIGIGKPAYVNRERMSPEKSIKLIKQCGGIPVLAHPGLVGSDQVVKKIIEFGVKGLEVFYYEHSKGQEEKYRTMARENNLIVTGGSDDHGPGNKDGFRLGKIRLDYELVEKMKECINQS